MIRTYTEDIGGVSVQASVEEAMHPQLEWLFQYMSNALAGEIRDGYRMSISFSVLTFMKSGDGLVVMAPDYRKDAMTDLTDDLTQALVIQMVQAEFLQEFGAEGGHVRYDEGVIVANSALESERIILQRAQGLGDGMSGWFITAAKLVEEGEAEEPDEYDTIMAYELVSLRPSALKVLTLSHGHIVAMNGDDVEEILDYEGNSLMRQ